MTLEQFLVQHRILGIAEIDTRRLTRLIREKGALKGCIYSAPVMSAQSREEAISHAQKFPGLQELDLAKVVSTTSSYLWQEGGLWPNKHSTLRNEKWQVVAFDFGIKKTILRCLEHFGCTVTVVPAQTSAEEVLALSPDGIFLSNGPGDPKACDYAISAIQTLLQTPIPLFGICLGHQLLALACGAKTSKMKLGHHGGNHPVRRLSDGKVLITSQNHGFTVEEESIPDCLEVTHRSLFDNTIQGIKHRTKAAFGFQGHPEAGPGPNDARSLFEDFISSMRFLQQQHLSANQTALEINE
jgi:carbamoyl-phosphate synthase small subunit